MEPVFTGEAASKTVSEANVALLVHLVKAIETADFCAQFNICRLHVKQFLKWNVSSNNILPKKLADQMWAKTSARSKSLKLATVASFLDLNLQEIRTE